MMKTVGVLMLALCVSPLRTAKAFSPMVELSSATKTQLASYLRSTEDNRPSVRSLDVDSRPSTRGWNGPQEAASNYPGGYDHIRGGGNVDVKSRPNRAPYAHEYGGNNVRESRRDQEPSSYGGAMSPDTNGQDFGDGMESLRRGSYSSSYRNMYDDLQGSSRNTRWSSNRQHNYEPPQGQGYSDYNQDGYRRPYQGERQGVGAAISNFLSNRKATQSGGRFDSDGRYAEGLYRSEHGYRSPYQGGRQGVSAMTSMVRSNRKGTQSGGRHDSDGRYAEGLYSGYAHRSPYQGERRGAAPSNMLSHQKRMEFGGRFDMEPVEGSFNEDGYRRYYQDGRIEIETSNVLSHQKKMELGGSFDMEAVKGEDGSTRQYRGERQGVGAVTSNVRSNRKGTQSGSRDVKPRKMRGDLQVNAGAIRTFRVDPSVRGVRVSLLSNGLPIRATVELWRGAEDSKQIIAQVNGKDGDYVPYSEVIETPGTGCTIAVRNTGAVECPLTARVEPLSGDRY